MESSGTVSNESILEQLKNGSAEFELVSQFKPFNLLLLHNRNSTTHRFFARVGLPPAGASNSSSKTNTNIKVEHYSILKVTGDGRCMFRALVKGMARNKGIPLTPHQERVDADELRAAVKEVICENEKERSPYQEAVIAITVDEPLHRYCQRVGRSDFWGGESELLVLSKLCKQPIIVYIPETEHKGGNRGSGFVPIAEYGAMYRKTWGKKPRDVVKLLYSGRNHYDLLV